MAKKLLFKIPKLKQIIRVSNVKVGFGKKAAKKTRQQAASLIQRAANERKKPLNDLAKAFDLDVRQVPKVPAGKKVRQKIVDRNVSARGKGVKFIRIRGRIVPIRPRRKK